MQQVIETQSDRIAAYMADREAASLSHQDESTGQGVRVCVCVCACIWMKYCLYTCTLFHFFNENAKTLSVV